MSWRSILVSLLAVALFGGPIMACAIPDAQLTAAEKQCCKDMGGHCQQDASGMPMPHSCCKTSVQPSHDFLPSSTFSFSGPTFVISAVELPAEFPLAQQPGPFVGSLSHTYSPPGEAVDASAPLRI